MSLEEAAFSGLLSASLSPEGSAGRPSSGYRALHRAAMMGHRPVLVLSELGGSRGRDPLSAPSLRTWPWGPSPVPPGSGLAAFPCASEAPSAAPPSAPPGSLVSLPLAEPPGCGHSRSPRRRTPARVVFGAGLGSGMWPGLASPPWPVGPWSRGPAGSPGSSVRPFLGA